MSKRPTGSGKYFLKIERGTGVVRAWLYNFDIDDSVLKKEHRELLDGAVGPIIRDGGSAKLMGLASTTGNLAHDRELGAARAAAVHSYLFGKFGGKFIVSREISLGKVMPLAFKQANLNGGTADNTESEIWRAVVINAWNRGTPPPPPPPTDLPFNSSTWASDVEAGIDLTAAAIGVIDTAADIFVLGGVAAVSGPLGLAASALSSIVAMPLIWANVDQLAETNGEIQGGADAIQDMADQFKDDRLDRTRMSKWPSIQAPPTHLPSNPQPTVAQQAWRMGQVTGRDNAVKLVAGLERDPKPMITPDGKHIRLSGRLFLRAIAAKFKDNAGVETVIRPANAELEKRGRKPFPTR